MLAVPCAASVYAKQSIIHIGNKYHVYSIRVMCNNKEYTFICSSELERDDWVEQLRTVGEHWRSSCMRHMQLCGVVKTWKQTGLFKKLSKFTSSSSEVKGSFAWEVCQY